MWTNIQKTQPLLGKSSQPTLQVPTIQKSKCTTVPKSKCPKAPKSTIQQIEDSTKLIKQLNNSTPLRPNRQKYYSSLSDQQIVALLLANDEEAVEYVFFHRCEAMFNHVLNSVLKDCEKKEELIGELYLFLKENDWAKLRQFEFKSTLNTWLTVVAVRYFQKKRQIQTKNTPVEPLIIEETLKGEADDYSVEDEMSRMELYKAIDRIDKPRERYALLADLSGKSADEIASDMQCTVSAVYNLTKKARLKLKQLLK